MAEDTPSLAEFLKSQRDNLAPCWCESAAPEIVAQVDAVLTAGSKQWTAMVRWLNLQLEDHVSKRQLERHKERGHHAR